MTVELQLAEEPDERDREAVIEAHADRVAERKLDGVRAYTKDGRLYTRSGNDITANFPEINPPEHHVLDGELITLTPESDICPFRQTNRRVQTSDRFKQELLADQYPAKLAVFDALVINGGDVRDEPLTERKALIEPSIPDGSGLFYVPHHDDVFDLWDRATGKGWEGIMLKDPGAAYEGGRGRSWLKVKDWKQDTFPVVGHEHTDDGGFVVYVAIGTDEPQKVAVQAPEDRETVEAGVDQVRVQYLERSKNGRLRKPSFKGAV